jgi:hypothetical protein
MRKPHIIATTYLMVITTWSICFGHLMLGLPLLVITYIMAIVGLSASLKGLLSLA